MYAVTKVRCSQLASCVSRVCRFEMPFISWLSQCTDFVHMSGVVFDLWHQPMQPSLTSSEAVLKCCTASSFPSPGFKLFELLCVWSFSHLMTRGGCTLSFVSLEFSFSQVQLGAAFEPWWVFFTSPIKICWHCWRTHLGAQSAQDGLQALICIWGVCYILLLCDTSSGNLLPIGVGWRSRWHAPHQAAPAALHLPCLAGAFIVESPPDRKHSGCNEVSTEINTVFVTKTSPKATVLTSVSWLFSASEYYLLGREADETKLSLGIHYLLMWLLHCSWAKEITRCHKDAGKLGTIWVLYMAGCLQKAFEILVLSSWYKIPFLRALILWLTLFLSECKYMYMCMHVSVFVHDIYERFLSLNRENIGWSVFSWACASHPQYQLSP